LANLGAVHTEGIEQFGGGVGPWARKQREQDVLHAQPLTVGVFAHRGERREDRLGLRTQQVSSPAFVCEGSSHVITPRRPAQPLTDSRTLKQLLTRL
jgi:hypothetical protein